MVCLDSTFTPSTELRWQTLPQDFVLADWTSTVAARVARRLGVFRAVLDRDNGLSVVLGESARSTPDDVHISARRSALACKPPLPELITRPSMQLQYTCLSVRKRTVGRKSE